MFMFNISTAFDKKLLLKSMGNNYIPLSFLIKRSKHMSLIIPFNLDTNDSSRGVFIRINSAT